MKASDFLDFGHPWRIYGRICQCLLMAGALLHASLAWADLGNHQSENPLNGLSLKQLPPHFFDFKPGELQQQPRSSIWLDTSDWVIDEQNYQSRRVRNFGSWLDAALAGQSFEEDTNHSFIRIGLASRISRLDSAYLRPEGRFRLDLPTTREKFRLIIENNPVETESLLQQERDRLLTSRSRTDNGTFGALRFLTRVTRGWDLSTDLGVKLGFPPKPFWRARASTDWEVNSTWRARTEEKVYYFYIDGWGASSLLNLARDLPGDWHFVDSSQIRWVNKQGRFEWGETLTTAKALNTRATLTARAGVLGIGGPNWRADDLFTDLTYRYRLYSNWLYGELIPAYEYTRLSADHLQNNPSITMRVEMFFAGGNLDREFPH